MKVRRMMSLILAVLCVCSLASGALAAETDARSQATQKHSAQLETDSEDQSAPRAKKGGKKQEAAEPENAIGKDAAKEKALADAGLSADQVEKLRARVSESDGSTAYKVRFTYGGQRYSYRIDALSGEILDQKVSDASEETSRGKHGAKNGAKKSQASGEEAQETPV